MNPSDHLVLFQFATSPFSEKVRRALHYKELRYETHEVVRAEVPTGKYADVSATGKFPVLQDGEHFVLDSTEILHHLEERFPDRPLIPRSPREAGIAHALEEWADESLYFYEMTMRLSWEHNLEANLDGFAASLPHVPREQLRTMILDSVGQLTKAQGVGRKPKEMVVQEVERHFRAIDGLLADAEWLVGETPSIADLAVIAQVRALLDAEEARSVLSETRRVAGWMERVDRVAPA